MARLIHQAALHLGARLGSVGLSFLLFAWIGRVLPTPDATTAYFFSFALGFGLATARMTLQLGAAINGKARLAQRGREAHHGLAILCFILPLLALGVGGVTWVYTSDPVLAVLAMVVTVLAAPDIDLLRGIVGRSSLFALSFSAGSLLALVLLQWILPRTLTGVVLALLAQWLPVCALNGPAVRRLWLGTRKVRLPISVILGTMALAGFDGLILNAPFLGWLPSSAHASLDLALVMRVFVASLPMLPLLMHWSNSAAFGRLCDGFGLSVQVGFILGLLISGLLAGCAFLATYVMISRQTVSLTVIGLYAVLLLAYSLFAPTMRFAATRLPAGRRIYVLAAAAMAYLAALTIVAHSGGHPDARIVVLLQALALTGTAAWLSHAARSTGTHVS